MTQTIQDRIRERLADLGIATQAASLAAGMSRDGLRKLLANEGQVPQGKNLSGLASALETTEQWLLTGEGLKLREVALSSDVRPAPIEPPSIHHLPNDVPVLGTAAGSHIGGAFQFEGGVIDWVRRPPAMMGAKNLYAVYIEGSSMVPEHNPGDLRFVHPDRPPKIGDSVIVEIQYNGNDGKEGMIGRLLKRTEKTIYIGKLNPEATVELKRETVVSIHKVLTINELFGV